MPNECWKPVPNSDPAWGDADDCSANNRWTPGSASSSIACVAVACLTIACWPELPPDWKAAESSGPTCVGKLGFAIDQGFDKGFS